MSTRKKKQVPGQVYFVQSRDGMVKVGVTTGRMVPRLGGLRRLRRGPYIVLRTFYSEDVYHIEQYLHWMFWPWRHDGEWFVFSSRVIEKIKSAACINELPDYELPMPERTISKKKKRCQDYKLHIEIHPSILKACKNLGFSDRVEAINEILSDVLGLDIYKENRNVIHP